jgi:PAS domain S-box-containing protein
MVEEIRKTGIDVIGDVPWGTHLCQFYWDKKDLIDILVPYFKAGLKNNEFCIWVTSEPLGEKGAKEVMGKAMPDFRYLRGQIEIVSYAEWYLKDGGFNPQRVLNAWTDKLNQALAKDYDGIRVTGNIAWLEKRGWRNFAEYEAEANSVIGKSRMITICTYPLDKCEAFEILDVARNHQFALIKHRGEWELIKSSERARVSTTAIIDAMGDGLVLLDMDGKITSVNPAFEKMTCYKKSEVVGKDAADVAQKLIKTEDLENAMEGLKTALEGKVTASGVLTLISKEGREIPITFSASVAKDTEGKPTTLIYNIKDIAEFKRAEERELKAQKQRVEELEKFAKVAVNRELKMVELKNRIKELESKLKEINKA